ncbi:MAG: hypothetical protein K6T94_20820, partial [Paenibacillus sp.]|nr:hypothetical protein [Paenibacillus sp.]
YIFFNPSLDGQPPRERILLERYQRYLRDNLVYGRAMQRLGTLLFCLEYAQQGGRGARGIWKEVAAAFATPEMAELYKTLEEVNRFRNTRIAHVESPLKDPEEAWQAMRVWLRCLSQMAEKIDPYTLS